MVTASRLRRASLVYFLTSAALLLTMGFVATRTASLTLDGWAAVLMLVLFALPLTVAGVGLGYLFASWDARER